MVGEDHLFAGRGDQGDVRAGLAQQRLDLGEAGDPQAAQLDAVFAVDEVGDQVVAVA